MFMIFGSLRTSSLGHNWLIDSAVDHIKLLDGSVKHVAIFKPFADKEVAEECAKVGISRLVIKF